MVKKDAVVIAKRVWGTTCYITMEQIGTGAYVQVPGDNRVHRLDCNGLVACSGLKGHEDCKEKTNA